MSFSSFARKVRNVELPMRVRAVYYNKCLWTLSYWIRPNYQELRARYQTWNDATPTERELLASLHELEALREQFHIRRNAYIARRQEQKRQGNRHFRLSDWRAIGDIELPSVDIATE